MAVLEPSSNERSRVRHVLGNVQVAAIDTHEVEVRNNQHVYRSFGDTPDHDLLSAQRHTVLRDTDDGLRIADRTVYLDHSILNTKNLTLPPVMTVPRQSPSGETRVTKRFPIDCEDGELIVKKLVSKGERLEIAADTDSIKLDALLLESLSSQSGPTELTSLLRDVPVDPFLTEGEATGEPEISISNEYSRAVVSKVNADAGDGLRVHTPARGTSIILTAPTLHTLASLDDTFEFSEWFKTPLGPEDAPLEGPL